MAITTATTTWEGVVGRKPTAQALSSQARKLLIYFVDVTFGASDDYVTNGVAVSLKKHGAKTYKYVIPVDNTANVLVRYDSANEKILMFGELSDDVAGTNTAASALLQLANASAIPNSKVFKFMVFATT